MKKKETEQKENISSKGKKKPSGIWKNVHSLKEALMQ